MSVWGHRNVARGIGFFAALVLDATGCASTSADSGVTHSPRTASEHDAAPETFPSIPARPLVLWEGDDAGGLMIPFTTCSESPCPASLTALGGGGRDRSVGVRFHGEGKGHISAGWRFDRSGDFTLDDALTMWLRVEAQSASDSPPLDGTWIVIFRGSMQTSRKVLIDDCIANFADGQAHRLVIPISTLYQPGDGFDPQRAEGIMFIVRSAARRNFNVYVNDIKLEILDAAAEQTLCQPAL